jgi:hypothetical protein
MPILVGRILTAPVLVFFVGLLGFVVLDAVVVFLLPARPARVVGQTRVYKARLGTAYYVEYQFDRSRFSAWDEVMPEEYRGLWVGEAVKAHLIFWGPWDYSALDRSVGDYAQYRMILWFSGAFALAIGWVILHAMWLGPWRVRWLAKHGRATFGAVVGKSIVHSRRRQLSFTLTYQFKAMGNLHARRIRISPQRYDSAGIKDLVIILFDPKKPARSIVYDYCDFIAMSSRAQPRAI